MECRPLDLPLPMSPMFNSGGASAPSSMVGWRRHDPLPSPRPELAKGVRLNDCSRDVAAPHPDHGKRPLGAEHVDQVATIAPCGRLTQATAALTCKICDSGHSRWYRCLMPTAAIARSAAGEAIVPDVLVPTRADRGAGASALTNMFPTTGMARRGTSMVEANRRSFRLRPENRARGRSRGGRPGQRRSRCRSSHRRADGSGRWFAISGSFFIVPTAVDREPLRRFWTINKLEAANRLSDARCERRREPLAGRDRDAFTQRDVIKLSLHPHRRRFTGKREKLGATDQRRRKTYRPSRAAP